MTKRTRIKNAEGTQTGSRPDEKTGPPDAGAASNAEAAPPTATTANIELMTPEEAANQLKVSPEHIRAMIRSGHLEAVNLAIGKKRPLYRIRAAALDKLVSGRCQSGTDRAPGPRFKRLPPIADHFPHLR